MWGQDLETIGDFLEIEFYIEMWVTYSNYVDPSIPKDKTKHTQRSRFTKHLEQNTEQSALSPLTAHPFDSILKYCILGSPFYTRSRNKDFEKAKQKCENELSVVD